MYSFDTEKGRMQMAFLEAMVPRPQGTGYYKKASFEFNTKDIHPIDQMELHKKTKEVVASTLTSTSMILSKLQVSLSNAQSQLSMEKISSMAKDSRIKYLEDLIVKLVNGPTNVQAVEEPLKKNNADIAALRKQLKMPVAKDPLAKGIEEQKTELMKLVIE